MAVIGDHSHRKLRDLTEGNEENEGFAGQIQLRKGFGSQRQKVTNKKKSSGEAPEATGESPALPNPQDPHCYRENSSRLAKVFCCGYCPRITRIDTNESFADASVTAAARQRVP